MIVAFFEGFEEGFKNGPRLFIAPLKVLAHGLSDLLRVGGSDRPDKEVENTDSPGNEVENSNLETETEVSPLREKDETGDSQDETGDSQSTTRQITTEDMLSLRDEMHGVMLVAQRLSLYRLEYSTEKKLFMLSVIQQQLRELIGDDPFFVVKILNIQVIWELQEIMQITSRVREEIKEQTYLSYHSNRGMRA